MRRLLAVLALTGALAPWTGSADATAPAHRLDAMIRLEGDRHWVGKGVYGKPRDQKVVGVLREAPGRVAALIRIVNTGTETTRLDVWGSSIGPAFYGGAEWPRQSELEPGESVTFELVDHRDRAQDGDRVPDDVTVRLGDRVLDGVRLLLVAK